MHDYKQHDKPRISMVWNIGHDSSITNQRGVLNSHIPALMLQNSMHLCICMQIVVIYDMVYWLLIHGNTFSTIVQNSALLLVFEASHMHHACRYMLC